MNKQYGLIIFSVALASLCSAGGVFDPEIPLDALNGTNGFRIDGIDNSDRIGISVSGAGDVNDDGISDFIIGGYGLGGVGESYVVFGQLGGFSSALDLSGLNGANGFRIDGIDGGDVAGYSVSGAGDVNGDHIDDVILGAPYANGYAGECYVMFGKSTGFGSSLALNALNGTNGFRIDGVDANDYCGTSVSGAGDVNGDGFSDVIIGAYGANFYVGESYVVFGQSGGFGAALSLSALNGTNGFRIDGIDGGDYSGLSVSGVGDVNGDGYDDLIIGASSADPGGNTSAGESYVVFGHSGSFSASMALSALNGANGFRMDGIDASDLCGVSSSSAGDVNGDGVDDLIVGARWANGKAGESYVVFGHTNGFSTSLALSALNGSNGFRIDGVDGNDYSGYSATGAGDINDDGMDDLIIGAYGANGGAGESYVVFGRTGSFGSSFALSTLNGTNGFQIAGIDAADYSGVSVSGADDVNGDGVDDLIIGAYYADPGGRASAGESYVIFGKPSGSGEGSAELIENLTVAQRPGDKVVDIYYDLTTNATISLVISNGLLAIDVFSVAGDAGAGVSAGISNHLVWIANADWIGNAPDLSYTLIAENGSGLILDQNQVQAPTDTREYVLHVAPSMGSPAPAVGDFFFSWKSVVNGSVEQTVSVDGTNYTCIGWHGTGSIPALGTSTNTGPITLTETPSTIEWRWIVDADADRMPDDWELLYYGSSTGAVATADTDDDGYNTWQEYILGSNPTNGGSSFLFTPSPSQPTNTAFSVDFTTVTGRLYTVECTDELGSGNWQVLTNVIGDGFSTQIIDPANIPACFYQIRIDWAE